MKKIVVSGFLFLSYAVVPASFAAEVSVMDHDGDGEFYEISRSAYSLADAGEYMANICYRGSSLSYAANNLHMAASRLYRLTSGNRTLSDVGVMDHDEPRNLPPSIHYAVEAVERAYASLDSEYRRYQQVDYRTQQAFYNVYNRYQSLMNTIPNR
jgi:hypothetical protein